MAWYDVNYVCGHQDRVQLYGPNREREKKIAYMERAAVCPACFTSEQERKRTAAAEAARQANADASLPELKGTDRQVSWAETIRAAAKADIEYVIGLAASGDPSDLEDLIALGKRMLRQAEASYWINKRDSFATKAAMKAYMVRRVGEERAKAAGAAALKGEVK